MSQPLVLGSSLTGLLISRSLSRAGVSHVLVGGARPPEIPRLGESANEASSLACWDLLGEEFLPYFRAKKHVSVTWGDYVGMIAISDPNRGLEGLGEKAPRDMGFLDIGPRLVHVDRARFDPALYDAVRADPLCRFVEAELTELSYDGDSDRIVAVELDDGTVLRPSHVFDATGYRGALSSALGLEHNHLSRLQRVVWRHRTRSPELPDELPRPWWHAGTNVVRLEADKDGVDGVAWVISLHGSVSIGLSVDAMMHDEAVISDIALMDLLESALQSRGIRVMDHYPEGATINQLVHRYYMRERAYGGNWMLAGPSFAQVWFPTSSGLSTSTTAAYLAPAFVRDPASTGAYYEERFRALMPFHSLTARIIDEPAPEDHRGMYDFWAEWLHGVLERAPHDLRITSGSPSLPLRAFRGFVSLIGHRTWTLLMAMGFLRIRVERLREDGGDPLPRYYQAGRFLAENLLLGWARYARSTLHRWLRGLRRVDEAPMDTHVHEATGSHSLSGVGLR